MCHEMKSDILEGIQPKQFSTPAFNDKIFGPFYIFPLLFTISLQPNINLHINYIKKDPMLEENSVTPDICCPCSLTTIRDSKYMNSRDIAHSTK